MNYNNFLEKYEEFIPVLMKDEFLEDLKKFQFNNDYKHGYFDGYDEGCRDCREKLMIVFKK